MSTLGARALVLLRVPRGAGPPEEKSVRAAIARDRAQLGLPVEDVGPCRLAGPYALEFDGRPLDEYVAWEV